MAGEEGEEEGRETVGSSNMRKIMKRKGYGGK